MTTPTGFIAIASIALLTLSCSDDTSIAASSSGGGAFGAGGASTTASSTAGTTGAGTGFGGVGGGAGTGGVACLDDPTTPAGPEAVLAPEFAADYRAFDLGLIPGAPSGHLGGCVLAYNDPNTLLFAGDSELATGGLYSIKLKRGPCGHIVGFDGSATRIAETPYIDANLVYGPLNTLFYTEWPQNRISQLLPGAQAPAASFVGDAIGIPAYPVDANGNTVGNFSVSGFGFVPPGLASAGQPRTVTWPSGAWYRLAMTGPGPTFALSNGEKTTSLPGGPGGFAYVPSGSPGFSALGLIVAEWSEDHVAVYEVDGFGDPKPSTRKEFFTTFPRPWGAYFEAQTGDFLFLTWGTIPDRIYVVQGFTKPPPPPDVPQ